ncbi:MAG: DUF349 domain-containing protein [Flavobacteriales bacterium]|nr:DUF349 domain-containing protein [Flavobacteriales bacterium]
MTENKIIENKNSNISNENLVNLEEVELTNLKPEELIILLDQLIDSDNPFSVSKRVENIKALFYKKFNRLEQNKESETLEKNFKKIYNLFRKNRNDFRKEQEQKEKENLKLKTEIISEIKNLTSEVELKKDTYNRFRELQKQWKKIGHVSIKEKNNIWQMYNHYVEVFYDYLRLNKDLRDIDFKKNLNNKLEICDKAEKLLSLKSLNRMHEDLQILHEKWKDIGPVNKENRDKVWIRFQDASKKINKKRNDYFLDIKKKDQIKLAAKKEICDKINKLSEKEIKSIKELNYSTEVLEKLSNEWKNLGRVNKKDNKRSWTEYRESLNKFYDKKNNFSKERKDKNKIIIGVKIKLCEEAESLQNSSEWIITSKKFINLQAQWKKSGFLSGKINDKLWRRFRSSCDYFFESKKSFQKEIDKKKIEKIQEKKNLISSIKKYKPSKNKDNGISFLKENINQWKKINISPNMINLESDYKTLCNEFLINLNLEKKDLEKEKTSLMLSLMGNNPKELTKEKNSTKEKIKVITKEIDLFETNKSYIVSYKKNNPLLDQINQKIEKLELEKNNLEKKLKILNKV